MPFPVIPVVVASGITALVTYVGVRMAMDEKCEHPHDDTGDAGKIARKMFYEARRLLEVRREKTQGKLESLGRQKAETFESALIPFEETFSRIRNVDLGDADLPPVPAKVIRRIAPESSKVREATARMAAVTACGLDVIGPDALAGLAVFGSGGVLLPESGGSAVPAPSGVAAGNATLAWLRGGALPPGERGTVILGRVAAAPVLLVNGTMLSSQADVEAVVKALSNLLDAEEAAHTVGRQATEVREALKRLAEGRLADDLAALRDLVSANDDYRTYGRPEKTLVARAASLAKTAWDVAETPLLGEDGGITDAIRQKLKRAKKVLKALETA